ncbi:unnamed protein product [Phytomonas sp. EM1]|nr:unnamed protein product [Phytomonas sp. EM1]|eukprot:CCW60192.1 unnamed protein product [Phytomonas sp. isolate EM1]
MPPKKWGKVPKPPQSPNTEAALVEYISREIRSNNCLGMTEDEINGMVDVLIRTKTRAEVFEWTKTLMLDESFATEVIKRRVDGGPPFEGETVARPSAVSVTLADVKPTGGELTISKNRKTGGRKCAPVPKKGHGSSLKPGRFECGCFATVHSLRGNCANCGRIICEQEADDRCYFCGLDPSMCVAYEIAVQEGKVTEAAQQLNRKSYEAAIARRDALLEHARNRAKQMTVIDDQSASLFSPQSAWVSHEERRKQEKSLADIEREKNIEKMHQGVYQVHLDLMSQNIPHAARHAPAAEGKGSNKNEEGSCCAADDHSSERDGYNSEASYTEIDALPVIEAHLGPLPSLLQKVWYTPGGLAARAVSKELSASQANDEAALVDAKDCGVKRQEEVSKRVQQSYFEEDAHLFQGESRVAQPTELIFNPEIAEDSMLFDFEEETYEQASAVVAPPVQSLSSHTLRFAPTPLMKLRDEGICLSMHQPWASLLIAGIKTHEGRVWSTNYRGRLWIHAATTQSSNIEEVENHYAQFVLPGQVFPRHYPTRALLGYVYLTDCMDQNAYKSAFPAEERQTDSPFVFICAEPTPLSFPLPMGGDHKLFTLDHKVQTAAKKQLMEIS